MIVVPPGNGSMARSTGGWAMVVAAVPATLRLSRWRRRCSISRLECAYDGYRIVLAFDIGGTWVRAALVQGEHLLASQAAAWPAPGSPDDEGGSSPG